jgi:hypothetical protein
MMRIGERVRWREWFLCHTGIIMEINNEGVLIKPDKESDFWPLLQPFQLELIDDN